MNLPLAFEMSDAAWASVCGVLLLIVRQEYAIKQTRLNAEIAREGRDKINENIDKNTNLTKASAANLESIAAHRIAIALGRKDGTRHSPEFVQIALPGVDYETFGLSTGDLVEWRSEGCDKGRKVRFKVHGPAQIGFHFHEIAEINFGVAGTLVYETLDRTVRIGPGESFTAAADEIHKASFDGPGEACCQWPDQEGDILTIGFYPQ